MRSRYYTVMELAEHLASACPRKAPARYFARQIRHWAYKGLFGPLPSRGAWDTAAQLLEAHHYIEARIFSNLTELDFRVPDLHLVRACFQNHPVGLQARRQAWHGTRSVLESFRSGHTDWRFVTFTDEDGEIGGGVFVRDSAIPKFPGAINPALITLSGRVLFDGLPTPEPAADSVAVRLSAHPAVSNWT